MLRYNSLNRDIVINLPDTGIYNLDIDSGTGKTYLAKCFKELSAINSEVDSFTYNDFLSGLSLDHFLLNKCLKVLVIDRYDMYIHEYKEEIIALGKKCIVLIDVKGAAKLPCSLCKINLSDKALEVSLL